MGCVLGLDVGSKTIGVAVSDPGRTIAFPVAVIERRGLEGDLDRLRELASGREVDEVVLGWPLNLDGSPGRMAEDVKRLGEAIAARLGWTVHTWDERLTTVSAERALLEADLSRRRRKGVIDKVAAALILQAYLDRHPVPGEGS